ncbi:MAG: CYTH domain-containing protein [Pseudomonadales bacterium]|nr:CYTH domain-containing protein [Halieaceae bacterium]MCP5164075.1 CYTH domain-containing protein [Pseudomonadales bacterium]MCP5189666.1 CYTH domain-containing protein [Pseudomonadales bacterium]MCP5203850.1 CYTH domain-containing protein [Pseudomonadales bacterium]
MATEIERKFLVDLKRLGPLGNGVAMRQGFIPTADLTAVRVRLAGKLAWLTLKSANEGALRTEFEYPIPAADAEQILARMCGGKAIEKTRYLRRCGEHVWEIDVFEGANAPLVVAEIELGSEQEAFQRPEWLAGEVTGDARYYNVNLLSHPFGEWPENR